MSLFDIATPDPDFYNATGAEKRAEYTIYYGNPDDPSTWFPYSDGPMGNFATLKEMRGGFTGGIDGKTPTWIQDGMVKGRVLTHEEMMTGRVPFPSGKSLGDALQAAGTAICKVIKAVAPFIAMIPGVGTVVGTALYAVGSIGAGDRIDQVAIDTIEQVLPEPTRKSYRQAINLGYSVARGQRVDKVTIDLARSEALNDGGPQAVAAFDAGLSIGTGKGLQDAGFKVLGAWSQGNDLSARAAQFADDIIRAQQAGLPLDKFLIQEAGQQFAKTVPAVQQAIVLAKAIQFFKEHPDQLIDEDFADLAERAGVPISAIRAAIICLKQMADGTLVSDPAREAYFTQYTKLDKTSSVSTANERAYQQFSDAHTPVMITDYDPTGSLSSNTSGAAITNGLLAKQGYAIAAKNPRIAMLRKIGNTDAGPDWKFGFDVATAYCQGTSQPGPKQTAVRESLQTQNMKTGFDIGQALQHLLTKEGPNMSAVPLTARMVLLTPAEVAANNQYATQGLLESLNVAQVAAGRQLGTGPDYLRGFDVGTGFCKGTLVAGNHQDAIRAGLAREPNVRYADQAQHGFDVAQAIQHGITKVQQDKANGILLSGNPNVAAGQLLATGLAGNGQTGDQKASTIGAALNNSQAKAGAAQAVAVHKGFFARILGFFGL